MDSRMNDSVGDEIAENRPNASMGLTDESEY